MTGTRTHQLTALITGATSGLGLACAQALLRSTGQPWHLIIASRDASEGKKVAAELNRNAGGDAVEFIRLDLADLDSVRQVGLTLRSRGIQLDGLVCNAGLQFVTEMRTAQGFEATFGINHLGHFALVAQVAGLLTPNARVVVVSSGTHDPQQRTGIAAPRFIDPEFLARPERDATHAFEQRDKLRVMMQRRYSTSKLCNLYFAYELNRRIADARVEIPPSVTVNAFDPGLMPGTGLARAYPPPLRFVWNHVLPFVRPFLKLVMGDNVNSPQASGQFLADLVGSPKWNGVTGHYLAGRREMSSSDESYDQGRALRLWEVSAALIANNDFELPVTPRQGRPARALPPLASTVALIAMLLITLAGTWPGLATAQDRTNSPVGVWRTFGDDGSSPRGLVRITERNGELLGMLAGSLVPGEDPAKICGKCSGERKDQPLLGMVFLNGLRLEGNEYVGGEILDPDTGQIYRATLRLEPGGRRIVVRGYVGLTMFGRSQTWERMK